MPTTLRVQAAVCQGHLTGPLELTILAGRVVALGPARGGQVTQELEGTLITGPLDLQVNGAAGRGVDEASSEALDSIAAEVLRGGATAFLPTLITAPFDELLEKVRAVAAWTSSWDGRGARPMGLHLEGPFLEVGGAHRAEHFLDPTPERIAALLEASAGTLRLVTLACARAGAAQAVRQLVEAGVCVSIGHAADPSGLDECIAAGARSVTHLFNAMGPLHHREPGVAGRVLADERLCCGLIPDGHHVHPVMLANAWRVLGPERTVIVTDCMAAAGMPDGTYELAGEAVTLERGQVRNASGALAGSSATMSEAMRVFAAATGAGVIELERACALNPRALIGAQTEIAVGQPAEFGLLSADGAVAGIRVQDESGT